MTGLIWGVMVLLTGVALLPHLSIVLTSFTDRWFMSVFPESYTLSHYAMVFDHPLSSTSIQISLFLSVLSTALDVVLGISIAYLLTRTNVPFKGMIDGIAMLPLALPGIVLAFGYLASYSGTFLDARHFPLPLLVIAYGVRRLPYMVRAAYAGFSMGTLIGAPFCAAEPRLRAAALAIGGGGFGPADLDPASFVGSIAPRPILFVNALRDERFPRSSSEALFDAAGEPKELQWFDCTHAALPGVALKAIWTFLERALEV